MDPETLNEVFDYVLKLIKEGGELLIAAQAVPKNFTTKSSRQDFVTEYDKLIEDHLVKGIKENFPKHCFYAEESAYGRKLPELTDAPTWIIDPIDGTTNFMKGLRLHCISVALVVNKKLLIGIIYNPSMNELYTAKKGQGSYLNGNRITTSNNVHLKDCLVSFSLYERPINPQRSLGLAKVYMTKTIGFRVLGSIAVALALLSSGVLDAYHIEGAASWDCAAGILLIEEAGGCVKSTRGKPYDIMNPNIIAACSESVFCEIFDEVSGLEVNLAAECTE